MRHHNQNKKFGRDRDQRRALFRSLARSLIKNGKIKTTEAKAKALRPLVEKMVTRARQGGVSNQRLLVSRLGAEVEAKKLLEEIGPRYAKRAGGYTRITKLPPRTADGSPQAVIEFV